MKLNIKGYAIFLLLFLPLLSFCCVKHVFAGNAGSVVINEIMWTGTSASSADEWVELFNSTDDDVDLTGWGLYSIDGSPEVSLEGSIKAGGYYLLERSDDQTVSDIAANVIYTGALDNHGEFLRLEDGEGNVIDEIDASLGWFGGDNLNKKSMERIDPGVSGSLSFNWCTNNGMAINGLDADGNFLLATPLLENSCCLTAPTPSLIPTMPKVSPTLKSTPVPTPTPTLTSTPSPTPSPTLPPPMAIAIGAPGEIEIGKEFEVSVSVAGGESGSVYFVKGMLGSDSGGTKLYDGRTLGADGESWLAWNAAWEKMPVFKTDAEGEGSMVVKMKTDEDVQIGVNYIKVRLREIDGGKNLDSNVETITVLKSGVASFPSPTVKPTPTPTPEGEKEKELVFTFGLPSEISAGKPFEIPVALCGADPYADYYAKVMMGQEDSGQMYDGQTLGGDGDSWLSWNAAWDKMPTLSADDSGCGLVVAKAKIDEDAVSGEYRVLIRLRRLGAAENIDSEIRTICVISNEIFKQTGGEVLGAMRSLPQTGVSLPRFQLFGHHRR
ncbi:hypothetical protein B5M47_03120 [candidate division CPR3 bacterium 4484_211]|uniref:LTD domain-containing protein n=1 Tax=candidate division CPR3 bacterium 4484_211 TaxID=1968527 RepID=A0A1W9NXC4_UNCC3|nr:MAG: hypothetical protein B5M47_03120 [candidate division CPR3 bacterium 4484_211]